MGTKSGILKTIFLCWIIVLIFSAAIYADKSRHNEIKVVPRQEAVTVDGDLKEWDLSGAIECYPEEEMKEEISFRLAFMYDKDAIYISSDFKDPTPMVNRHDPMVSPKEGWAGDCLQFRICSDTKTEFPLLPDTKSDKITHLTMWYYTDKKLPSMHVAYGMDFHGEKVYVGKESDLAFKKTDRGYILEGRIPWKLLHADGPPKPGEFLAATVQGLWGKPSGEEHLISLFAILNREGFAFMDANCWGKVIFFDKGNLVTKAVTEKPRRQHPLNFSFEMPRDGYASLNIYDGKGRIVRTLLAQSNQKKGDVSIPWDGLDDKGRPILPGNYTYKILHHTGVTPEFVLSVNNSGNPPWQTADGTGGWGADHGVPVSAVTDGKRVYLGWSACEAGWGVIAVDQKGKKLWGIKPPWSMGDAIHEIATDGGYVYVAQSGSALGKDDGTRIGNITRWDATDGRRAGFAGITASYIRVYETKEEQFRGLTVGDNKLFVSLDKMVVVYDLENGEKVKELKVKSPRGLVYEPGGTLLAVSEKQVVRIDMTNWNTVPVVTGLDEPDSITKDSTGTIYVSDRGAAQQVKAFSPEGKLLRTIGKPGGRPRVGRYDPLGMLEPGGLAIGHEGDLWVAEEVFAPKRFSRWGANGQYITEYLGGSEYSAGMAADPENPENVYIENMRFVVDYEKRTSRIAATLLSVPLNRKENPDIYGGTDMGRYWYIRHYKGREFILGWNYGCAIIYEVRNDVAKMVSATGNAGTMQNMFFGCILPLPPSPRPPYAHDGSPNYEVPFLWYDINGDGHYQKEEMLLEYSPKLPIYGGGFWGDWIDQDLTIYTTGGGSVVKIPVDHWAKEGIPVYPKPSSVQPLFAFDKDVEGAATGAPVPDGRGNIYIIHGATMTEVSLSPAIACYSEKGQMKWAYRHNLTTGFGLQSRIARVGDITGAQKICGVVSRDKQMGGDILAVNGYFGQFNLLNEDGLYVAQLMHDTRSGPVCGPDVVWTENFNGFLFKHKRTGKIYLLGGDTDGRIWELKGLETIRQFSGSYTITEEDYARVHDFQNKIGKEAEVRKIIHIACMATPPIINGSPEEWDMAKAVEVNAGEGREAKVAISYDARNLYLIYDVKDTSPMVNSGSDAPLMFKTGDCVDLMLRTNTKANPDAIEAQPGDTRLFISMLGGKPVVVLGQEKVMGKFTGEPYAYRSPTGEVIFERVEVIKDASVSITRSKDGYVAEAEIPLAIIGFMPGKGVETRIDVGIIFSDAGGTRNAIRAYWANTDTAIINDIPSEARLQPQKWGKAICE